MQYVCSDVHLCTKQVHKLAIFQQQIVGQRLNFMGGNIVFLYNIFFRAITLSFQQHLNTEALQQFRIDFERRSCLASMQNHIISAMQLIQHAKQTTVMGVKFKNKNSQSLVTRLKFGISFISQKKISKLHEAKNSRIGSPNSVKALKKKRF